MFDNHITTGLSVANSDFFILRAIETLQGQPCTQADIIAASGVRCGRTTLWRSLNRLQNLKRIEIQKSRSGSVYVIRETKTIENA